MVYQCCVEQSLPAVYLQVSICSIYISRRLSITRIQAPPWSGATTALGGVLRQTHGHSCMDMIAANRTITITTTNPWWWCDCWPDWAGDGRREKERERERATHLKWSNLWWWHSIYLAGGPTSKLENLKAIKSQLGQVWRASQLDPFMEQNFKIRMANLTGGFKHAFIFGG